MKELSRRLVVLISLSSSQIEYIQRQLLGSEGIIRRSTLNSGTIKINSNSKETTFSDFGSTHPKYSNSTRMIKPSADQGQR